MKVFFTTTPRLKVHYYKNVEAIFNSISKLGHTHTSDYIVKVSVDNFYKFNKDNSPKYYDIIIEALKKADVVVFETSMPSFGVGHLLQLAFDHNKAVIALHMPDKSTFMLSGIKSEKLISEEYSLTTIDRVLKTAFERIQDQIDERFTLLLPPRILTYLDEVSAKNKIPRSVFIRNLIEREMNKK